MDNQCKKPGESGMKSQQPPITQETVDALARTQTMEEFLSVAAQHRVDWNALPDEWLDAVTQGDVTELVRRLHHKPKTGKKPKTS